MLMKNPIEKGFINLRVVHNYDNGDIFVYVKGKLMHQTKAKGRGGPNRFKCGVYSKEGMSNWMHVYWANLNIKKITNAKVHQHHHHE